MPRWLHTLISDHRMGMGVEPWITYANIAFDARTMTCYAVRIRGIGWEYYAHAQNGELEPQVKHYMRVKKEEACTT